MIGGDGWIYVRVPRTGSTSFVASLKGEQRGRQHAASIEGVELWGKAWRDSHTFGFIRNPWDWLVSMYNANLSEGAFGKEPLPGGRVSTFQRANLTFDEWVRERRTTPIDWLTEVDEVCLFEDFIPEARVHLSAKKHPHYREWYSTELMEYVTEKCGREIEIGNYTF